ncbi:hypothetical protein FEM03_22960 [Phragmitibacter flavus]|uniref:Ribonuclease VapC n=1 Tax=Phragmitibacter flavus TaxID=2576071 RepID=A0A5R8K7N8_9BACT|nr:TA system VapC family ribonuclease toxin [Phragmitibacter flavus]TLD68367.1 hypothetical protein FEM03_22960 [Phragmitibacter flavus]
MKHLCDLNVFIAGALATHTQHASAKIFFDHLSEGDSVEFCRATQIGFLRLLTQKIAPDYTPLSNRGSREALAQWLVLPYVHIAPEPIGIEALWLQLSDRETPSPKVWMDAWLAAFAICSRMRLVTFDQGFERYRPNGLDLLILT